MKDVKNIIFNELLKTIKQKCDIKITSNVDELKLYIYTTPNPLWFHTVVISISDELVAMIYDKRGELFNATLYVDILSRCSLSNPSIDAIQITADSIINYNYDCKT